VTAFEFLKSIPHVPMTMNGNKPIPTSNSERRRWLERKSVNINGEFPGPNDEIKFPLTEVVIFAKSPQRRCTLWHIGNKKEDSNGRS